MSDPVTLFSHIPKTAGSTLQQIVRSQYSSREIVSLYHLKRDEALKQVQSLPEHVRIITGHVRAGFTRFLSRPSRLITVLRDPVDCTISNYYYIARMPSHALHQAVTSGESSLLDIARRVANRQALYVSGLMGGDPRVSDNELLARAKENLQNGFAAFGLMECFDETVVLFNRALNWRVKSYVRQNVTRDRPKQEQIDSGMRDTVREALGVDLELYAFAKEQFRQLIQKQAADFGEEVKRLQARTHIRGRFHAAYRFLTLRRS